MTWLGRLLRTRSLDRDLDRELRAHLDLLTDDLMRSGLSREEATRRARISLGGVEQIKEASRDARGTRFIQDWWQDTRYAFRALRRAPGFSAAAILTLALGIGANTAVWSVLDALVLRALPVEKSDELYAIRHGDPSDEDPNYLFSYLRLGRFQAELPDSVRLGGMSAVSRMYLTAGGQPEPVEAQLVTGNWFPVLGVGAARGRTLGPGDDGALGANPVAVLSDAYWGRRLGGSSTAVGSTIRLNGVPLTVVGIAEPGFDGLTVGLPVDVWVPVTMQEQVRYRGNASSSNADTDKAWLPQDGIAWLTLVTRVPRGLREQAGARLAARYRAEVLEQSAEADSATRAHRLRERLALEPLAKGFSPLRAAFREPLRVLMASVGLVLLIACANLASLLMARSASRSQEVAVRVSLGARPGRLLRQMMTESMTLALLGGLASLAVAWWGGLALLRAGSAGPRPVSLALSLDGRVLGFAFGLSVLTGLLFGMAPALRAARTAPFGAFKTGGRVAGRALHRLPLGRVLVTAQIALSLVLIAGAGLFVRTLRNVLNIDTGYAREQILEARIDPRAAGYTVEQLPAFHQRLLDAVGAVPGVRSVGLAMNGLAAGAVRTGGFQVPGVTRPPEWNGQGQENYVTPGYFANVGMILVRGREFTEADRVGSPRVSVVSEAFAKHFFGSSDVVGRRFGYGEPQFEIVGVVRDARVNSLRQAPSRLVFHPLAQAPDEYVQSVEARTAGPAAEVVRGIRAAIASVDPNLPLREVVTVADLLERRLSRERLLARLAGAFSGLALLLAAVGLYGVVAYSVSQRTNEMGIRLALGAVPWKVWRMVLKDSLGMVLVGLAFGVALWVPMQGLVRNLVYGLSPRDPMTLLFAVGVLATVGVMAASLPAWRAARVDPARALRSDG
jgi:predicted permease